MRRDIQGLRGVAVLLVVAFHAGLPVHGGSTGVDVFFVISGFVITGVLLRDNERHGGVRFARFYARRVLRLLPALAVMLTAVAVVGTLASPAASQRQGALTGAFTSVFAANAYLYNVGVGYFDASAALNPLLHTWTLAVEEQFYVVFPLLLVLGWRVRGRRGATVVLAGVGGASLLLALTQHLPLVLDPQRFVFYASPTRAWEFAAGAVLALLAPRARPALGVAGLGCIAVGAAISPGFPQSALLPVAGAAAVIWAAEGTASQALGTRPLTWIGDRSYGWYLWHWPLIVFAAALWPGRLAAPAAAALSLVPAWASYRWIETPFRQGDFRPVRLAAICVTVPVAAAVGLLFVNRELTQTGTMTSFEQSQRIHADHVRGCDTPIPLGQEPASCTWRTAGAHGRVVLLGDSNAGQFTEPVARAANRLGYDATVGTLAHCPFVDLRGVVGTRAGEGSCRRFYTDKMTSLLHRPPALVILASVTPWYLTTPDVELRRPGGELIVDSTARASTWEVALRSTVQELNRAGIPVLVVHPVPEISQEPSDCAVVRILLRSCVASISRDQLARQRAGALAAEEAVVSRAVEATGFDLADALCTSDRCSTMRNGLWLYRDRYHLSVAGALTLTGRFERAISTALRPGRQPPDSSA